MRGSLLIWMLAMNLCWVVFGDRLPWGQLWGSLAILGGLGLPRRVSRTGVVTTLLCCCSLAATAQPQVRIPDQPIRLFNGTDLSGFTTWLVDSQQADPHGVFTVTNGLLRISGQGLGYLSTVDSYRDYHLVAEFRWGIRNWGDRLGKARDSGLFLHSFGPDGNSHDGKGAFKAAIECNLFQGATGDVLLIRGSDGRGRLLAPRVTARVRSAPDAEGWYYFDPQGEPRTVERWGRINWLGKSADWEDRVDYRGPRDLETVYGGWTRLECICRGDGIVIKVNGQVVNELSAVFPTFGPILLQCEGSEIYFRRLELLPLSQGTPR